VVERRGRGDERRKKGVKEGGKEALTALVWGQENDFYFKHLLKLMEVTDDTSQLPERKEGRTDGRKEGRKEEKRNEGRQDYVKEGRAT
jgi:hypothetical protein